MKQWFFVCWSCEKYWHINSVQFNCLPIFFFFFDRSWQACAHAFLNEVGLCHKCENIRTLIHAIEYLVQFLLSEVTVVFSPVLPSFTPQDDQLPLCASQSCKMWDLHNHRSKRRQDYTELNWILLLNACLKMKLQKNVRLQTFNILK